MTLTLSLIISFFVIRGFRFEFGAKVLVLRNTESFIWLLLFVCFAWFFNNNFSHPNRRLKRYAVFFALVIAFFHVIGGSLERMTNVSWIWESRKTLANFLNMYFSFACLYYCFAFTAFSLLEKYSSEHPRKACGNIPMKFVFLFWVILLICYIPWFLYWYPGMVTEDTGAQILDALSVDTLSDHNPAFVTFLMRIVLVPAMKLTGSIMTSVGILTFLQMMAVTFVFALAYVRICQHVHHPFLRVLIFLWFAAYTVNNVYSVTLWKDIPFSACLLGFSICLDRLTEDEKAFFAGKRNCFLLFASTLLLMLLRHNGIFVTVPVTLYLLLHFKSFRRKVCMTCGMALLVFGLWKILLIPLLHIGKSPSKELVNVPIQQIARVLSLHQHDIPPSLIEGLEEYFKVPEFWADYWEKIADPVKTHFRSDAFQEDPGKFLSLWWKLGKMYPVDYLEAFLQNNYGYWYPETSWWITSIGVVQNVVMKIDGLHTEPIVRFRLIDDIYNWYNHREYNKTPLLPLFYKPGAVFWVWVFCGIYCLYLNRRKFVLFLPGFMIWVSLQWSAVYCEFRYAYGLFVCLPLLLAASLTPLIRE